MISFVYCLSIAGCAQNAPPDVLPVENSAQISASAININAATAEQMEKLPGVGAETARRIVEHREKYGRFRRAEHLILVRGISDEKFRVLRTLVKAE